MADSRFAAASFAAVSFAAALLASAILAIPAHAAGKTIKIDFNSTADFTESCGAKGKAKPSGLTKEQKDTIIAGVQAEYDDAVGAGNVMVMEGTGGDVDMIVSGDDAPAGLKEYGDAGQPGKPGVVHKGRFDAKGFTDAELTNGIAVALAHEAGHKFGLDHNESTGDNVTKMTSGGATKLNDAKLKADNLKFSGTDKDKLKKVIGTASPGKLEDKTSFVPGDLGVRPTDRTDPGDLIDRYLDAFANYSGPVNSEIGYISYTGDFVAINDVLQPSAQIPWTFMYDAGVDVAVMVSNSLFTLEHGNGSARPQ